MTPFQILIQPDDIRTGIIILIFPGPAAFRRRSRVTKVSVHRKSRFFKA